MIKKIALIAGLGAIAGCTNFAEVTTPPQPVAYSSAAVQQATTKTNDTTFRSFAPGETENKAGDELIGASCSMQGSGFGASFVTPAIVQMPQFKGAADPISVRCSANGQTGSNDVKPINLTLAAIQQSTGQTSLLGILVEAAFDGIATAARNPLNDKFGYAPLIGVTIPGAPTE